MADNVERVGLVFDENGSGKFIQSLKDVNLELNKNYNAFKLNQAQWDESTTKIQKLREEQEYLTNAYELQNNKIILLKEELSKLENAEDKNTTQIKRKRNELLNAQIQLEKYSKRIEKTETALSNAEKGIKSTSEKIEELTQKMKENDLAFELTKSKYTSMTTLTTKLKDEQNYLTNSYKLQEEKIELLNEQLEELNTVEDKNAEAISRKKQEILSTETSLQRYQNQINEVNIKLSTGSEKIKEYGKNLENAGNIMNEAGNKVSVFSVASLTALTAATKGAINFESAFTGVEKTVDATDEELAQLKKDIRQMAKEIPASTTEISAVAEAAGQLGIKTKDIMNFTRTMIDLGNSTNLSAEEAASSLAKFANVTKMNADNYSNLGSTIVALGNNFATTEKDIVEMATKLASTGELTGLTESQILALATSMSSVGIEAEAGGSAMSKLLKEIKVATETGSKKLDKFAKVAGMTSEEFKKAFQKDSVKALSLFIKGLNDTERNGKSAIAILDDMGLKEVRLSNTILSLANSNDLMNDAVDLANKSWNENNALNKEASTRYETLESKITTSISKLKDIGITVGEKVMPIVEKFINKSDDWSKKFESLNDEQVETIVKIGGLVAAAGPALKILGSITSGTGQLIKTFGSLKEHLGMISLEAGGTGTALDGVSQIISGIVSPVGLTVAAFSGLTAATVAMNKKINENINKERERTEEIRKTKESLEELKNQQQENMNANLSEIDNVERLKNELSTLVDENGNVKEEYKGRVQFILNKLNGALGTEYKMTGNVIDQYKDLRDEIDATIEKKKASIILSTQEEAYTNAIKGQADATKKLGEIQETLNERIKKRADLEEQLETASKSGGNYSDYQKIKNQITALDELIGTTQNSYSEQEAILKSYYEDIATYETNAALVQQGTAEAIKQVNDSVLYSYQNRKDQSIQALNETLNTEIAALNTYKDTYANNQNEVTQTQMTESQKRLDGLVQELVDSTSIVNDNSPEVIKAWTDLAYGSYSMYYDTISKMPPDLAQKIQEMTGVTAEKRPELVNETKRMAEQVLDQIEKNPEFKQEAMNNLRGMLNGLEDGQLRELLNEAGVADANKVIEGIRAGNLAEDTGMQILNSLKTGLNNKSWKNSLFSVARGIASTLSGLLTVNANVNGKLSELPGHKSGLDYVPKDNYVARLHKGERVLTKEENEDYTEAEKRNKKRSYSSSIRNKEEVMHSNDFDYERLFKIILKALNNCKIIFDRDGFTKFIDNRLMEVM